MVDQHQLVNVLSELAGMLGRDLPIQRILDRVVEGTVPALGVTAAGLTPVMSGEGPRYIAASSQAARELERVQAGTHDGPSSLAHRTGAAVAVPDVTAEPRFPGFADEAKDAGIRAVFAFPLKGADGVLGALTLYGEAPGPVSRETLEGAQALADVAAAYLHLAQTRVDAELEPGLLVHRALHDPLTELGNRALLRQRLAQAALRSLRTQASAALVVLGLDDFQALNDRLGPDLGDEVLRAVSRRLSTLVRPGDTVASIDADEFALLCEDLGEPGEADLLVKRVGDAFTTPLDAHGCEVPVEVSLGVAYAGPGHRISPQMLAAAGLARAADRRQRAFERPNRSPTAPDRPREQG